MAEKKNKPPFYLIDTQSTFYKPMGVRLAICISVALWASMETWFRDPFWSVISIACAVYCAYVLFWAYEPPEEPVARPPDPEDDEEDIAALPEAREREEPANDDKPKI